MIEEQLTSQRDATVDELTGLSNRRGFLTIAERALASCERHGLAATLCYIDLDGFKQINDKLGHHVGDCALREFGAALQRMQRGADVVARFGGDEFCVFFTGTGAKAALEPIARLRRTLDERNRLDDRYQLAFSAGMVQFDRLIHAGIAGLMEAADSAMFAQKSKRSAGIRERIPA